MADIRIQGIHSLRFVLQGDSAEVFQREAEDRVSINNSTRSVADQMMATAAARHLPTPIEVKDQRDELANRLIQEFVTHPEYGSFADARTANESGIQQFKRLGQVFYFLSPFFSRIRTTHHLPTEFNFVDGAVVRSSASHKSQKAILKQDELLVQLKRLGHVLDAPCIKSNRFRFSAQLTQLKAQLDKYHLRMLKQNELNQKLKGQTSRPAARYDRAAFALPMRTTSVAHLKYGDRIQKAVTDLNSALANAGECAIVAIVHVFTRVVCQRNTHLCKSMTFSLVMMRCCNILEELNANG